MRLVSGWEQLTQRILPVFLFRMVTSLFTQETSQGKLRNPTSTQGEIQPSTKKRNPTVDHWEHSMILKGIEVNERALTLEIKREHFMMLKSTGCFQILKSMGCLKITLKSRVSAFQWYWKYGLLCDIERYWLLYNVERYGLLYNIDTALKSTDCFTILKGTGCFTFTIISKGMGCFTTLLKGTGVHKSFHPTIQDGSTWSKFGARGEHGDVPRFSTKVFSGSPT